MRSAQCTLRGTANLWRVFGATLDRYDSIISLRRYIVSPYHRSMCLCMCLCMCLYVSMYVCEGIYSISYQIVVSTLDNPPNSIYQNMVLYTSLHSHEECIIQRIEMGMYWFCIWGGAYGCSVTFNRNFNWRTRTCTENIFNRHTFFYLLSYVLTVLF